MAEMVGWRETKLVFSSPTQMNDIFTALKAGLSVEYMPAMYRYPWGHNRCDWCGEIFAAGDHKYPGYNDNPTHQKCARAARRAYREDHRGTYDDEPRWETPVVDYPNGQGTWD